MRWLLVLMAVLAGCSSAAPNAVVEHPETEVISMKLTSPAFEHNGVIPEKFSCEGQDVSPELNIEDVPDGAESLVLVVDDPDAPSRVWEHWTVINIPPETAKIAENSAPQGSVQLMNDFGRIEWGGPCPPPGKVHHYNFRLYALDTTLDLDSSERKADVEQAMQGHILEETVLVGTYER